MIAVDTNLLVYAHRSDSPFHAKSKSLLEALRGQPAPWAVPWPCLHEFLAVVTHPRIFKKPSPVDVALACVESWGAGQNLHLIGEGDGYLAGLRELIRGAGIVGPRIHDARIAAICRHHGVHELWSADRDFSAFPSLIARNPLAGT